MGKTNRLDRNLACVREAAGKYASLAAGGEMRQCNTEGKGEGESYGGLVGGRRAIPRASEWSRERHSR